MDSSATPPVIQLFSNPDAGKSSARRVEALTAAFEAAGARVLPSVSAGGPPDIAEEATQVCVAGGDGTVRHVASAVLRSGREVRMSIFPSGTINLLAREARYPRDPQSFARLVLTGTPARSHYPVALNDGHFFACAGVGPDSLAVANVSRALKRSLGRFAYVAALMRMLARWPRYPITLVADGREIECEAFYVAKSRYYAGPWSLAPDARMDSPAMHVVALRRARRRDYLHFIATLAAHRDPSSLKNVEAFRCSTLRAEAPQRLPIQADGDVVGHLPATMAATETPLNFA